MSESVIPPGSVIVTPEDMWTAISEIRETGHRTETAIAELKLTVNPAVSDLRRDFKELDGRVTTLEHQSWSSRWVPPLVSAIIVAAIGGVLVYTFVHLLK